MRDNQKTKDELLQEVETLRKRVAKLTQTEEVLCKSEGKYHSLVNNIPDVLWTTDSNGNTTFISPNIKEVYGYKPEDIYTQGDHLWLGRIHPDDVEKVKEMYKTFFEKGIPFDTEYRIKRKDGKWIWLHDRSIVTYEKDGVVYADGMFSDITKQKEREKELKDSEERYRTLSGNIPGMIYRAKADWSAEFFSHNETTCCGYFVEDLKSGKIKWLDIIHPDDKQRVFDEGSELAKEPGTLIQEYRIFANDGSVRWVEDHKTSTFTDEGKLVGVDGVVFDITERKLAEEEIIKFKEMADRATYGYAMSNPKGNLTYINESFAKMHGYTPVELIGKNIKIFHTDEQIKRVSQLNKRLMETGEGLRGDEVWHVRRDGTEFPTLMSNWVLKDPDGNPYLLCATAIDITEHKRMEEALRESEKQFREIFENIAVGVYRTTPDGQILMANPALVHMLGYSSFEELRKRNLEEEGFEPQYQRSMYKERIEREGRIVSSESTWITRDGKKLHVIENARAVRDENGKTLYYEGTAENITERRKAEETLRESEERYRTLVESAGESIAMFDKDGVFLFINEIGAKCLGGKPEDYVGKAMRDLFPKKIANRQVVNVRGVINTGQGMSVTELTELQGRPRWYNITLEPLRNDSGKVTAVLVIARDIHEHRQAEEELGLYREKMTRAERLASVGALSAIMAHTLNDLLTVIQLSIQDAMAESKKTPRQSTITKYLKEGLRSVSEVSSTVHLLGKFASESSKEIISKVNLKAVAERTVKLLSESARRTKMSMHLEGMGELPPIYSNERDLEQLFFSLAENAIQAADGKKSHQLIIRGAIKDEKIELRFTDDCGGIAKKNLDKIFELFFTTNPPGEGTGLGLCIVERNVTGAGGNIRVESKAGKGTTFFVTLPLGKGERS